jgi:hypothetical protein
MQQRCVPAERWFRSASRTRRGVASARPGGSAWRLRILNAVLATGRRVRELPIAAELVVDRAGVGV